MDSKGKIGIVGSGLIGKSWAMIFASVGYKVLLYSVEDKLGLTFLISVFHMYNEYKTSKSA
jgi:3-hydroxyacyl-CoA dehydrogenase